MLLNQRLDRLTDYPFQRLATLLGGAATPDSIVMSIGEPQHTPPAMVARILAEQAAGWGKYPPLAGTPDFRKACAGWLSWRFGLAEGQVDPDTQIVPVAGTREALYGIAQAVVSPRCKDRPVVLLPNPFYQVYAGAAIMAGAEPVFVPATEATGFQPDFAALPAELLDRAVLAYLCNPANPQGSVMDAATLSATIALARKHDFVLAVDECYSEIYDTAPPPGALAEAARLDGSLSHVVVFHSLSKRSSVPGLRSGFVAGDAAVMAAFSRLRSYGGAAVPLPIIAASAALWRDEEHVETNRGLYRQKIDLAEQILGGRFGFRRPAGGFFLWLDVGDGEAATKRLWQETKIRVLPGAYLAREGADGVNPGQRFIRVALVHDLDTTEQALRRMAEVL